MESQGIFVSICQSIFVYIKLIEWDASVEMKMCTDRMIERIESELEINRYALGYQETIDSGRDE